MAGAFVCASLGIVPTVRHADYIGSWLEKWRARHFSSNQQKPIM
jgi:antirestriction protein ArdC